MSVVLGDLVDAAVIGAVVLLNGIIGFFQEYRAEQSIASLSKTLVTEATVVRDGLARRVPSAQLACGDIVALQSGDTVPADLRLLVVKKLKVEEAALTGESVPADKRARYVHIDASTRTRRPRDLSSCALCAGRRTSRHVSSPINFPFLLNAARTPYWHRATVVLPHYGPPLC